MSKGKATRNYDSSFVIPENILEKIMESARRAPASFGFDLVDFIVLQNDEKENIKDEFLDSNVQKVESASAIVILKTKTEKYFELNKPEFIKIHYGLYDDLNIDQWASRSAYINLSFLLLAASSLEIDSLPMEGFKKSINNYLIERNMMDETEKVSLVVCLGKSNE